MKGIELLEALSFEEEQKELQDLIDILEYYRLLLREQFCGSWEGLITEYHLGNIYNTKKKKYGK